jgi:hypothetical protein
VDAVQRHHARAGIVERAPRFLEPLIARFATEDQYDISAIDALGRSPRQAAELTSRISFGAVVRHDVRQSCWRSPA